MSVNPLVSVAIITYNHKEYLREAIESVLAQGYDPLEIVIGDDYSTDGTQQMLKEYDLKFPGKFLLCLSDRNRGITVNSNAVHFACRGKYIAWLGGDDLMLPGKIARQVAFLEKNPDYNIVYHNLDVFDALTGATLKRYNSFFDTHTGDVTKLIKYGTFNGACATMVRHSSSPTHGFNENLLVASDWLYWIEHLEFGGKIGYINEVLGKYRRHTANVSANNSSFSRQGHIDGIETTKILERKFPRYKRIISFRKAVLYRGMRHLDYLPFLQKSFASNPFSFKTILLLLMYYISFGKLRL